jgi:formylglycine-generating enzyme required for sulfatase activity
MPQATSQPPGIFICYRRDDSAGHAGRLYDTLTAHFGNEQVFMDIDLIEPGEDFVQVIEEAVGSCEILLALVGRRWLASRDEAGRRLDNPNDFVRLEIATALARGVHVIPLLVQGAQMPRPRDLPEDLLPLARRHALELSDIRWRHDIKQLIGALEKALDRRREARRRAEQEEAERVRREARAKRAEEEAERSRAEEAVKREREAWHARRAREDQPRVTPAAQAAKRELPRTEVARRGEPEAKIRRPRAGEKERPRRATAARDIFSERAALDANQHAPFPRLRSTWSLHMEIFPRDWSSSLYALSPQGSRAEIFPGIPYLVFVFLGLLLGVSLLFLSLIKPAPNGAKPGPAATPAVQPAAATPPQTFTNSVGMEFAWVPPGEFTMGSENGKADERPAHRFRIRTGFYIGKYEVTQAQWQAVMGNNPSYFKGGNRPVENVSWEDVRQFVEKLNLMNDGRGYRLPTEADWEYAARAGTNGDYAGELASMGWYFQNSGRSTHPVGGKRPNAFGLYDMHGNVYEWVLDAYRPSHAPASADGGVGPTRVGPTSRVIRGGSWGSDASSCRSASRNWELQDSRRIHLGFRVAASPTQ